MAAIFLAGIILLLLKMKVHIIPLAIVILLLSGLIGYVISKILFTPVHNLYKRAETMHLADLEHRIGGGTEDELARLSRAFDIITDDLAKAKEFGEGLKRECGEKEKAIEELKRSEEHFRMLFEESNDAVFIYDLEGKIIDVNNKACDMLGYPKNVLLNMPFLKLHTEEELTKTKRAYKTGKDTCALRFESKFKKSDGSVIDVEVSSSCVDLKRGIMQGIVRNITERKELIEALKESEEKFRTFMETASDLMYIADKDGNFTYVNDSMANVLGYSKEELKGKHVTEIQNEQSARDYAVKNQQLISMGEIIYEPVWETKNRLEVEGEVRISAIYDDQGNFAGSRGVFRDISERKKVERSHRLAELGKLSADVAHEVNNPVTIIMGNAELAMMDEPEGSKYKKIFKIIADQCEVATNIVKRLLMFSKPSKEDYREVNINKSIDIIAELVESQFRHGGVKIRKNLSQELPPVKVDEKQMQEVFMNLLRNSFEAMPEGGAITVKTSHEEDKVRVDFTDTGSGISDEDLKKIFDPFFTTKKQGTGLGLSVCYGILQAHGGDLKYTSKPGKGTTATVILPVAM
ncbi:MAG: PAS domain S-box protein [Candidatus Omnitrophota bacterium]